MTFGVCIIRASTITNSENNFKLHLNYFVMIFGTFFFLSINFRIIKCRIFRDMDFLEFCPENF